MGSWGLGVLRKVLEERESMTRSRATWEDWVSALEGRGVPGGMGASVGIDKRSLLMMIVS